MTGRILAVRLDSDGDVLLTGPAIRCLSRLGEPVDLLASPSGAAAARLLPDVADVLVYDAPWSGFAPPGVDPVATTALVDDLAARGYGLAVIFTSFHQSPLPMALLARLAGIRRVVATSADYPGSLLDVRHRRADPPAGGHEVEAAIELAAAAGAPPPADDDDTRLALRRPLPDLGWSFVSGECLEAAAHGRLVVLHPGASVPSRALDPHHAGAIAAALAAAGWSVAVTGSPGEREPAGLAVAEANRALSGGAGASVGASAAAGAGASVGASPAAGVGAPGGVVDLSGRTSLAELAALLDVAACTVVGNTGPAHLSAAVGTPIVSLFSPVVPSERWAPWGVPVALLGDQSAPCRGTRARECPIAGHPCLTSVEPRAVVEAVERLVANAAPASADPGSAAAQRGHAPELAREEA